MAKHHWVVVWGHKSDDTNKDFFERQIIVNFVGG